MAERDELAQLDSLRADGVLTDAEYAEARDRVLAREDVAGKEVGEGAAEGAGEDAPEDAGEDAAEHAGEDAGEEVGDPGPSGREPNWLLIGLAGIAVLGVALIIVALVAGGSSSSTQPGIRVNGVVAVADHTSVFPDDPNVRQGQPFGSGGYNLGKPCHTLSGYQDIVAGANVVISDGSANTLATTHLQPGVFDSNADCVFGFTAAVAKVDAYQVKIGQRNPVSFSQKEIASPQLILN